MMTNETELISSIDFSEIIDAFSKHKARQASGIRYYLIELCNKLHACTVQCLKCSLHTISTVKKYIFSH